MMYSLAAQDRDQDRDRVQLHEYLVYEDAILLHITDRDQTQLRNPIKLLDGRAVNIDGTYADQNGILQRLQNGNYKTISPHLLKDKNLTFQLQQFLYL